MNNYHNLRDASGKFTKQRPITVNRLYDFKGITVRTKQKLDDGFFWCSSHRVLEGAIHQKDLKFIDNKTVKNYLKNA